MVELVQLYREHGLDLDTTELPDFLPVFLEFLSGLELEDATVWLESVAGPLRKIDRELQLEESPWQAATAAILDFAGSERDVESQPDPRDIMPSVDADYYEAPVTFGGAPDPAYGCAGCPQHP